jgi:hypothetical protein
VWEKAGVNVSVVYGSMPPEAYRAATGNADAMPGKDGGRVPFFAAGISSVMHPKNPHCPTMHFNYRCAPPAAGAGWPGLAPALPTPLPTPCCQARRPSGRAGAQRRRRAPSPPSPPSHTPSLPPPQVL